MSLLWKLCTLNADPGHAGSVMVDMLTSMRIVYIVLLSHIDWHRSNCLALSCVMQVLCRNSGSTLGYGFATLMEDADDSSSEEDEPLRPMTLTEAVP